MPEENNGPTMYVEYETKEDGSIVPIGYAYGDPWVSQALMMGDMKFKTPEAAKEWWEKHYG
ncbi:MAG: hypothetical protein J6S14_19825 [Clostridia bacterium]|nr:hypothetical protein [Clostridia bacterium]